MDGRYRVRNSIGAHGLPARQWADAARARLQREPAIESVRVEVVEDRDEFERSVAGIELDVCVRGLAAEAAAALVEREFMHGLADVVGDREVGWTAYVWEALPDNSKR